MPDGLAAEREWARAWLFDAAFPLWWESGYDAEFGGFYDQLDQDGKPLPVPKRLRVQARQIYVYAEAGRLGWQGPWREAVERGIAFLLSAYKRGDGLFRASVARDGKAMSDFADLYDQAFVLFALAAAYRALADRAELLAEARRLLHLLASRHSHPTGGFRELDGSSILRSNPHMHMVEALLAWIALGVRPEFEPKAREIIALALARFLDPATGAVGEYFNENWGFAEGDAGRIREPGHQFEWAYLLDLADNLLATDCGVARDRLHRFGFSYGISDGRVLFSVDASGRPLDASSRLWAQSERLRTALVVRPSATRGQAAVPHIEEAECFGCLKRFLVEVKRPGLWRDRIASDGSWVEEPAPATSFYHILTGFAPLLEPRPRF